MAINSSKKGLFMTILILILFLLILGELITFALLTINYNTLDQSSAQGASSLNYGKALSASAGIFANASLNRAVQVLASYELNASMRKSNLITNTSQYLAYLMVNGTLPNVAPNSLAANYLANNMANLTLQSYNASVRSLLNLGSIAISINETKPQVFQRSSYTLSVSYVQNVALNSSSGRFTYQIPVNATIALNGTPDLASYERGIPMNVKFAPLSNLTNILSGITSAGDSAPINATSGNFLGSIYGPVYTVPGGVTCATLPSNLPGAFTFAPYNQFLIIATTNAIGITNGGSGPTCINQYGGLITYSVNSLANPPSIPWLLYPSTSNYLNNIKSGQQVLIQGNSLSTLNIQNLINSVGGGSYFGSPFTPSYLDRAQSTVTKQNPNGMLTLGSYNTRAASFNAISGWIDNIATTANQVNKNAGGYNTVAFWMLWRGMDANGEMPIEFSGTGYDLYFQTATCFGFNTHNSDIWGFNPANVLNKWTFVVAKFYNGYTSNSLLSINGNNVTLSQCAGSQQTILASSSIRLGGGYTFNGELANFQLYNTSLNQSAIQTLYQRGITGAPLNTPSFSGWWPLNGNANDYSGNSNNGVVFSGNAVPFTVIQNYSLDPIFSATVPSATSALPGILNCRTNANCTSTLQPKLSLGYLPLESQQRGFQVAQFNGVTPSYINVVGSNILKPVNSLTVSFWLTAPSYGNTYDIVQQGIGSGKAQFFIRTRSSLNGIEFGDVNTNGHQYEVYATLNTLGVSGGSWYHFVMAINESSLSENVFVNGIQKATNTPASLSLLQNTNSLTIGGSAWDGYLPSTMANLQIYNNSLSANQVAQLYQEGITGLPLLNGNVVGWWPLNGNANDYSGFGNNGVATNVIYSTFANTGFNSYNGVTGYFNFAPYNSPGLSTISATSNEWQSLGIPKSG